MKFRQVTTQGNFALIKHLLGRGRVFPVRPLKRLPLPLRAQVTLRAHPLTLIATRKKEADDENIAIRATNGVKVHFIIR